MGVVNRKGCWFITVMTIGSICTVEHQPAVRAGKISSRNELEREIEDSISIAQRKTGYEELAGEESSPRHFTPDWFPQNSYSFHHEEFIAGLQYNAPALDYDKLWYGEKTAISAGYAAEQDYESPIPDDAESDMLTTQEAEKIFMKKQLQALQGNMYEGSADERWKLYLWIAFNPSLFKLFESLHGLTRDTNYTMN